MTAVAGQVLGEPVAEPPAAPDAGTEDAARQEPYAQAEEERAEQADHIRRLRRQGLGAPGIAGFGSGDAAGTINKHYYGTAPQADPVDGRVAGRALDRLREVYVEPASYGELVRHLDRDGVAVLRGPAGSGRYTTAVLAAQKSMDAEVVVLDPETDLKRLLHKDLPEGGLQSGHGHVVESDGRPWAATLRAPLLNRLREETYGRSPLVIIVDDQVPVDGLDDYIVEHAIAENMWFTVLEGHVSDLLKDRPEDCRKLLEHEALREELRGRRSMTEIVSLARVLAQGERDGHDIDQIVQGLKARLRVRAKQLLRPPKETDDSDISLWSMAFLLACMVLDGTPLSRVSRESHRLAELLHGVRNPSSEPQMPLFRESLDDWLHDAYVEFTDREGQKAEVRHPECRVRISQPGLGEAVLEVLWHDHSGARRPLLEWLDTLVIRCEEDIRVTAAQTVGLLATFDWVYVQEELLVLWATDKSEHAARRRFAAAWALERAAVSDAALASKVRKLLRSWSQRREFHACAEAAYGTQIGNLFPAEALSNLEKIARSRMGSVRDAVQEIYAAGSREQTLERLAAWSLSPHYWLRQDAAMCLQQLSRFHGELAITGLIKEPASRGHLLRLTRNVLLSRDHTIWRRGWDTVRLWVERAGDEPGLEEALAEFVAELPPGTDDPSDGLRQRFVFYLRLWKHQSVGADAAGQIDSLVRERWS